MTTIPTTVGQPEAVVLASAMGHTMRWDGKTANRSRWVCVDCGAPVYDNGVAIFGEAKRERCGEVAS